MSPDTTMSSLRESSVTAGPGSGFEPASECGRIRIEGRRLHAGGRPVRVHGVTYGPFRSGADRGSFPTPSEMARDLRTLRLRGINAIRIPELPPPALLELAGEHGVRLLTGLHFCDWRSEPASGLASRRRIAAAADRAADEALELLAGRREVLGIVVGAEVPIDLVRLHHRHHVERTLTAMIDRLHAGDPHLLATYVNSPSTEFLQIPNQDLVTFSVVRAQGGGFESYLAHLREISCGRPVLVTEMGRLAAVHGPRSRAAILREQLRAVEAHDLAGAFVFSWANEWVAAGDPTAGWHFDVAARDHVREPAAAVAPARRVVPLRARELSGPRSA